MSGDFEQEVARRLSTSDLAKPIILVCGAEIVRPNPGMIVGMAIAVLCLAGCAVGAGSINELKTNHARQYDFEIPAHYEDTYLVIAQSTRNCFTGSFGTPAVLETDLLPETRRGSVAMGSSMNTAWFWAADITPTKSGGSHVTVWNYLAGWDWIGPRMRKWTDGDLGCSD